MKQTILFILFLFFRTSFQTAEQLTRDKIPKHVQLGSTSQSSSYSQSPARFLMNHSKGLPDKKTECSCEMTPKINNIYYHIMGLWGYEHYMTMRVYHFFTEWVQQFDIEKLQLAPNHKLELIESQMVHSTISEVINNTGKSEKKQLISIFPDIKVGPASNADEPEEGARPVDYMVNSSGNNDFEVDPALLHKYINHFYLSETNSVTNPGSGDYNLKLFKYTIKNLVNDKIPGGVDGIMKMIEKTNFDILAQPPIMQRQTNMDVNRGIITFKMKAVLSSKVQELKKGDPALKTKAPFMITLNYFICFIVTPIWSKQGLQSYDVKGFVFKPAKDMKLKGKEKKFYQIKSEEVLEGKVKEDYYNYKIPKEGFFALYGKWAGRAMQPTNNEEGIVCMSALAILKQSLWIYIANFIDSNMPQIDYCPKTKNRIRREEPNKEPVKEKSKPDKDPSTREPSTKEPSGEEPSAKKIPKIEPPVKIINPPEKIRPFIIKFNCVGFLYYFFNIYPKDALVSILSEQRFLNFVWGCVTDCPENEFPSFSIKIGTLDVAIPPLINIIFYEIPGVPVDSNPEPPKDQLCFEMHMSYQGIISSYFYCYPRPDDIPEDSEEVGLLYLAYFGPIIDNIKIYFERILNIWAYQFNYLSIKTRILEVCVENGLQYKINDLVLSDFTQLTFRDTAPFYLFDVTYGFIPFKVTIDNNDPNFIYIHIRFSNYFFEMSVPRYFYIRKPSVDDQPEQEEFILTLEMFRPDLTIEEIYLQNLGNIVDIHKRYFEVYYGQSLKAWIIEINQKQLVKIEAGDETIEDFWSIMFREENLNEKQSDLLLGANAVISAYLERDFFSFELVAYILNTSIINLAAYKIKLLSFNKNRGTSIMNGLDMNTNFSGLKEEAKTESETEAVLDFDYRQIDDAWWIYIEKNEKMASGEAEWPALLQLLNINSYKYMINQVRYVYGIEGGVDRKLVITAWEFQTNMLMLIYIKFYTEYFTWEYVFSYDTYILLWSQFNEAINEVVVHYKEMIVEREKENDDMFYLTKEMVTQEIEEGLKEHSMDPVIKCEITESNPERILFFVDKEKLVGKDGTFGETLDNDDKKCTKFLTHKSLKNVGTLKVYNDNNGTPDHYTLSFVSYLKNKKNKFRNSFESQEYTFWYKYDINYIGMLKGYISNSLDQIYGKKLVLVK